jgi:hypothetical protein
MFSLLNSILTYDCDGYMVPYANHIQRSPYVDRFFKACFEMLLLLSTHQPATSETKSAMIGVFDYLKALAQTAAKARQE